MYAQSRIIDEENRRREGEDVVVMLDGLFRQGLAIRLAVVVAEPSEVLGNVNA